MIKSLHEKAVLVKFTQHSWSGRKVDQVATAKVAKDFETKSSRVGTYHKMIVPREYLQEAADIRRNAYIYHLTNTLPWMDGGVRMTPVTALKDYLTTMRKFEAQHKAATQKFAENYTTAVKEGMLLQGKLANAADYPSAESIAARFGLDIIVMQLPSTTDWRIDVPKQQLSELKAQAEQDLQTLQKDALQDLYRRLGEAVSHAKERLDDEKNIFRNSLFENLREVVSVVAKLNFAADPKLEAMRKEIEAKLAKQTADVVRADPGLRKQVASDAAAIMKKMSSYMVGVKK
jgi:hypothetical protein